jgi:hypothetical protein
MDYCVQTKSLMVVWVAFIESYFFPLFQIGDDFFFHLFFIELMEALQASALPLGYATETKTLC